MTTLLLLLPLILIPTRTAGVTLSLSSLLRLSQRCLLRGVARAPARRRPHGAAHMGPPPPCEHPHHITPKPFLFVTASSFHFCCCQARCVTCLRLCFSGRRRRRRCQIPSCCCTSACAPGHAPAVQIRNIVYRYNDSRLFMNIVRMDAETALIPSSFASNALKIAAMPLDAHGTSLLHAAAGQYPTPDIVFRVTRF